MSETERPEWTQPPPPPVVYYVPVPQPRRSSNGKVAATVGGVATGGAIVAVLVVLAPVIAITLILGALFLNSWFVDAEKDYINRFSDFYMSLPGPLVALIFLGGAALFMWALASAVKSRFITAGKHGVAASKTSGWGSLLGFGAAGAFGLALMCTGRVYLEFVNPTPAPPAPTGWFEPEQTQMSGMWIAQLGLFILAAVLMVASAAFRSKPEPEDLTETPLVQNNG